MLVVGVSFDSWPQQTGPTGAAVSVPSTQAVPPLASGGASGGDQLASVSVAPPGGGFVGAPGGGPERGEGLSGTGGIAPGGAPGGGGGGDDGGGNGGEGGGGQPADDDPPDDPPADNGGGPAPNPPGGGSRENCKKCDDDNDHGHGNSGKGQGHGKGHAWGKRRR
jgi:hypothetical protein